MRTVRLLLAAALTVTAAAVSAGSAWAFPNASFEFAPESPLTHEPVTFTSTATTDPLATIVSESWDLDDDGEFDDASGPTATFSFGRPGSRRVALQVVDSLGNEDSDSERVTVGNRPPAVSFFPVPAEPSPGTPITFVSTSSDPDGFIASHVWDLDDDGQFDDASGATTTVEFPASGRLRVGLRAFDDSGAFNTYVLAFEHGRPVSVEPSAGGGDPRGQALSPARLLSPFPVVRVSGIVTKRGIRLRALTVTAPVGSAVSVRCGGRGCAFRRRSSTVAVRPRPSGVPAPATGTVRFRALGRRVLRFGAIVRVYVTRADAVGKYTRLRVRRGRLPARADRCVPPAVLSPIACPSA